ncbi:MAG TPA: beta-ketoacyl-[acyl-carrier-protein] synthase family protein, partial [Chitinophaga sp.]
MAGLAGTDGYTRTTLLGLVAIQEALRHAGIAHPQDAPTGLVNATTVGGMVETERSYFTLTDPAREGEFMASADLLDCGDCSQRMADAMQIDAFVTTISTACSSSANALMLGARMIKQGLLARAVCGGTEALTRFTLNGFTSLKNTDRQPCRPFDQQRNGLNLGEGAAYLVLESESLVKQRGASVLAELTGYANTNEAFHATAPSPEGDGALAAMQEALHMSGRGPQDIQYINVHGTATLTNDASEGKALQRLFGTAVPPFSSTKPFTGHTLAAAGAVEAIFSVLAIREQVIFPNLHFSEKMEELDIVPNTELRRMPVQHVLSNSFGFGGNNASLVISKY